MSNVEKLVSTAYDNVINEKLWEPLKSVMSFQFRVEDGLTGVVEDKAYFKIIITSKPGTWWWSYISFSYYVTGPQEPDDYIYIEQSETEIEFRKLSLNTILRVVLCKMAERLNVKVTSNAISPISAYTLCNMGFQMISSEEDETCENYSKIVDRKSFFERVIDAEFVLNPGGLKGPTYTLEILRKKSEILRSAFRLPQIDKLIDDLLHGIYIDTLVGEIQEGMNTLMKVPDEYKILIIRPPSDDPSKRDFYSMSHPPVSNPTIILKRGWNIILRIPFILNNDGKMTILKEFDVENFTGDSSLYKVLLCVLCNLCIRSKLDLYIYPRTSSSAHDSSAPSLSSQLSSLNRMGFTLDRSNPFVARFESEFGVGDLGDLDDDISMVFYSEGKRPFTRDDMDPRLFPESGENFLSGGGGGGGDNAPSTGGGPLGGDNAALALFGLFVTVVAAGFSSARPY